MRIFIYIIIIIANPIWLIAQTTTLLTYDANGNRTKKQIVGSSPHPTISASLEAVNPGQASVLTASGCTGGNVVWLPVNQTANQITVNPTVTTQYTAQCIVSGCTNRGFARTTVTVIQCPTVTLSAGVSATPVKYGQNVSLYAFGCDNGTVSWSTGQIGTPVNIKIYGPSNTFTARCSFPYCTNVSTANVVVAGTTGCSTGDVLVTAQNGNWTATTTWACGRIPTLSDEVYLNHEVQVNANGSTKGIIIGNGFLNYPNTSFLTLPQN